MSVQADPLGCKRQMAYIPDNPDLYEFMTGIKYLNFIADVFGVDAGRAAGTHPQIRRAFELTGDLAQPIAAYSHGMKQKLAIISAWLHEPKLILMDEPFVGLDPKASHLLKGMMRELCDRGGAIFFSTHVLEVAEKLCDKVAIIKGGKLIRSGTMEEVKGDDCSGGSLPGTGGRVNAETTGEKAAGGNLPQLSVRRQEEPEARPKEPSLLYFVLFVLLMVGVLGGMFTFCRHDAVRRYGGGGYGLAVLYADGTGLPVFLGAFGSVFNTYSSLYLAKDNDLLLSLPIPLRVIMASRLVTRVPDGPDVLRRGDRPGRGRVLGSGRPQRRSHRGRAFDRGDRLADRAAAVLPAGLGGGEDQPEAEA